MYVFNVHKIMLLKLQYPLDFEKFHWIGNIKIFSSTL